MALKIDVQWWRDADGKLTFGDVSLVTCPDDDPHQLRGSKGERIVVVEPEPKENS